jgi:hypothetical protein
MEWLELKNVQFFFNFGKFDLAFQANFCFQMKRFEAMWVERQRQYYIEGKKDQHYAPAPPMDSR